MKLIDIVGLVIGIPSVIIGIIACYYAYKAAKILGGGIGNAFIKLAIGCVLMMFSAAFQGITMGALDIYQSMTVAVTGSGSATLGAIFLIAGFRGVIASTHV